MIVRIASPVVVALIIARAGVAEQELVERERTIDQLPQVVARALEQALAGRQAEEIEEICLEGLPVLYEAEYTENGREVEIVLRPNGERVEAPAEDDDEDEAEGGDDDAAADDDDAVTEGEVTLADLPRPAAESLRRVLRNRTAEIESVTCEGVLVLYEVEIEGGAADDDDDEADDDDRAAGSAGARAASNRQDEGEAEDDDAEGGELFLYPDGRMAYQQGELTEREVSMDDLPRAIAQALEQQLGGVEPDEIEEIRCEGVPILYEAEVDQNGEEREFAVRGDGAAAEQAEEDDDDEAAGDDDEGLSEREIEVSELPEAVAVALRNLLKGEILEADEITYEGVIVLYDAEGADEEVSVYPNGALADRQRDSHEDDAEGDDESTDDDDDDDDDVDDEDREDNDD